MGLIGGSLGMAAKKNKVAGCVVGLVRKKKSRAAILKAKAADKIVTDYADVIGQSQLVVLAVPLAAMEGCAKDIFMHAKTDTVITDVGSVKGPVVNSLERVFSGKGQFVGSHPMAGSEKSGIEAARSDLFQKALCILTPSPSTHPKALSTVQKFWHALGAKTCLASAQDHDSVVAMVSHLPHLVAACLMHSTVKAGEGFEDPTKFIGPSFRDVTRIAASSPELWTDIILSNRSAILRAASSYVEGLEATKELIERRDREGLLAFFRRAQAERLKLSLRGAEATKQSGRKNNEIASLRSQ